MLDRRRVCADLRVHEPTLRATLSVADACDVVPVSAPW